MRGREDKVKREQGGEKEDERERSDKVLKDRGEGGEERKDGEGVMKDREERSAE